MKKKKIGLQNYIGKDNTKVSKKTQKAFTLAKEQVIINPEAQSVMKTYARMTKTYIVSETYIPHFTKVLERLREHKMKKIDYIMAHIWFYGEKLQPYFLLGKKSMYIYQSYMDQKNTPQIRLTQEEYAKYRQETILFLAKVRQETVEETEVALQELQLLQGA
jgi:hypothetical protein